MHSTDFYNKTAQSYDIRQENPWTEMLRKEEVNLIRKYAKGKILDVGCGTGFHLHFLEKTRGNSKSIIGIDPSEEMLKLARKNTTAELMTAFAEKLPFADESFDTVLCLFTVLNLCDAEKALREMYRVLKGGGFAILSVASVWDNKGKKRKRIFVQKNPAIFRLFTKDELESEIKKAGLSPLYFNSLFRSVKPKWGNWQNLTEQEVKSIKEDEKEHVDKGAIYLAVARK